MKKYLIENVPSAVGPHRIMVYKTVFPEHDDDGLAMSFDGVQFQSLLYTKSRLAAFDCIRAFWSIPCLVELSTARILVLGAGGCSLPVEQANRFPSSEVWAVEHDLAVINLAKRHFVKEKNVKLVHAEAMSFINACVVNFGRIFIDILSDKSLDNCGLFEIDELICKCISRLSPNGDVLINTPNINLATAVAQSMITNKRNKILVKCHDSQNVLIWLPATNYPTLHLEQGYDLLSRYKCSMLDGFEDFNRRDI